MSIESQSMEKENSMINPEIDPERLKNAIAKKKSQGIGGPGDEEDEKEKKKKKLAEAIKSGKVNLDNAEVQEKTVGIDTEKLAAIRRKQQLHQDMHKDFVEDPDSDLSTAEQRWLYDAKRTKNEEQIKEGLETFKKSNEGITGKLYYFDPETMQPKILEDGQEPPVDPETGMAVSMFGANSIDRFISGLTNGAVAGAGVGSGIGALFGGVGAVPGAALGAVSGGLAMGVINAFAEDEDYLSFREGNDITDDGIFATMAKTFNNTLLSSTTGLAALGKLASEGIIGNETLLSDFYDMVSKKNEATQMQTNPLIPSEFQKEEAWDSVGSFFSMDSWNFDALPVALAQGMASATQYIGSGALLKMGSRAAVKGVAKKSASAAARQARIDKLRKLAKEASQRGDVSKAKKLLKGANKIAGSKPQQIAQQFAAGMMINNQEIMQELESVEGLSVREKAAVGLVVTFGMSGVEMIGGPDAQILRNVLKKNGIIDEVKDEIITEVKEQAGKKLTGKALKKFHDKAYYGTLKKLSKGGWDFVSQGIAEGAEEVTQSAWQDVAGKYANYLFELDDETGFNADMASPETWTEYFNAFSAGALTGSTMNTPKALKAARISGSIGMAQIIDDQSKVANYVNTLNIYKERGYISKEEHENAIENLNVFESFHKKTKDSGITKGQRKDLFVAMFERHNLEKEKLGLPEDADTSIIDEQIKKYDQKIKEILDNAGEVDERKKKANEKRAEKEAEKMAEEEIEDAEYEDVTEEEKDKKEKTETPEEAEARNSKDDTKTETPEEAEARNSRDDEEMFQASEDAVSEEEIDPEEAQQAAEESGKNEKRKILTKEIEDAMAVWESWKNSGDSIKKGERPDHVEKALEVLKKAEKEGIIKSSKPKPKVVTPKTPKGKTSNKLQRDPDTGEPIYVGEKQEGQKDDAPFSENTVREEIVDSLLDVQRRSGLRSVEKDGKKWKERYDIKTGKKVKGVTRVIGNMKKPFDDTKLAIESVIRNLQNTDPDRAENETVDESHPRVKSLIAKWDFQNKLGTSLHGLAEAAAKNFSASRILNAFKDDPKSTRDAKTLMIPQLREYISKRRKDGATVMPEFELVDPDTGLVMIIDLLEVNKDGSLDIVDFKVKEDKKASESAFRKAYDKYLDGTPLEGEDQFAARDYAIQMKMAKNALERLGYKVNDTKVKPISARIEVNSTASGDFNTYATNLKLLDSFSVSTDVDEKLLEAIEDMLLEEQGVKREQIKKGPDQISEAKKRVEQSKSSNNANEVIEITSNVRVPEQEKAILQSFQQLDRIASKNPRLSKIAALLSAQAKKLNTRIIVTDSKQTKGSAGQTKVRMIEGQLLIDVAVAAEEIIKVRNQNKKKPDFLDEVIVHEEIHRYTSLIQELYSNPLYRSQLTAREEAFAATVNSLFQEYKQNPSSKFPEIIDAKEFLAYGLTDKAFIAELKKRQVQDKSIFEKLLDAVLKLLGSRKDMHSVLEATFEEYIKQPSAKLDEMVESGYYQPTVLPKQRSNPNQANDPRLRKPGESIEEFVLRNKPIGIGTYGVTRYSVYPGNVIVNSKGTKEVWLGNETVKNKILESAGLKSGPQNPKTVRGQKPSPAPKTKPISKVVEPTSKLLNPLKQGKKITGKLVYNKKTGYFGLDRAKSVIKISKKLYNNPEDYIGQEITLVHVPMDQWNPDGGIKKDGVAYGDKIEVYPVGSNVRLGSVEVDGGGEYIFVKESKIEGESITREEGNSGDAQAETLNQGIHTHEKPSFTKETKELMNSVLGEPSPIEIDAKAIEKRKKALDALSRFRNNINITSNHIGSDNQRAILLVAMDFMSERIQENDSIEQAIKKARKLVKKMANERDVLFSKRTIAIFEKAIIEADAQYNDIRFWEDLYPEAEAAYDRETEDNADWKPAFGNEDVKADRFKFDPRIRRQYATVEGRHPAMIDDAVYDFVYGYKGDITNIDQLLEDMKAYGGLVQEFAENHEAKFPKSDLISYINVLKSQKRLPHLALFMRPGKSASYFSIVNKSKSVEFALLSMMNSRRESLITSGKQITDYEKRKGKVSETTLLGQYKKKREKITESVIPTFNRSAKIENGVITGTIRDSYGNSHKITHRQLLEMIVMNDVQYVSAATGMEIQDIITYLNNLPEVDGYGSYIDMIADYDSGNSPYVYKSTANKNAGLAISHKYVNPMIQKLNIYWDQGNKREIRNDAEFYQNARKFVTNEISGIFKFPGYASKYYNEEGNLKTSAPLNSHVIERCDEVLTMPINEYYEENEMLRYYREQKRTNIPPFVISGIKNFNSGEGSTGKNISPEDVLLINFMGFYETSSDALNDGEYFHTLGQFADKSMQIFIPAQKRTASEADKKIEFIRKGKNPDAKYLPSNEEIEAEIDKYSNLIEKWSRNQYFAKGYEGLVGSEKEAVSKRRNLAREYVLNSVLNTYYSNQIFFGRTDNYGKVVSSKETIDLDSARKALSKRSGSMASGGLKVMMGIPGGLKETYRQAIYKDTDYKLELTGPKTTKVLLAEGFENGDGILFQSPRHEKQIQVSAGSALTFENSLKPLVAYVDEAGNPIMDKLHRITITQEMVDENPEALSEIWKAMTKEENPLDTFVFDTGAKLYEKVNFLGKPMNVLNSTEYTKDGRFKKLNLENATIVERKSKYIRIQQQLNNDGKVKKKRLIPQMMRHIKKLIGSNEFDNLSREHLTHKMYDFKHQLRSMSERDKRQFVLDSLSDNDNAGDVAHWLEMGAPIEHPVIEKFIFSTINSQLKKDVLDMNSQGALHTTITDMVVDQKLKGPRMSENGKEILPGEVLVPRGMGFKENDLLFITRMPCDDLHSVSRVKVVGFLPESMGNKIAVSDADRAMAGEDLDGDQRHIWKQDDRPIAKYLDPQSEEAKERLKKENIKRAKYNALKKVFGDEWKFYANSRDLFKNAPRFEGEGSGSMRDQMKGYQNQLVEHLENFQDKVADIQVYRAENPIMGMYYSDLRYLSSFVNTPEAVVQKLFDLTNEEYKKPENFDALTHPVDTNRLDKDLLKDQISGANHLLPSTNSIIYDANRSTTGAGSTIGVVAKTIATAIEITNNNIDLRLKNKEMGTHDKKKLREIFIFLGDALNQSTDNAKLMKLHRMKLNNENSSLYMAMALKGYSIKEIIDYMSDPFVESYFRMIRLQNMVSNETISAKTNPVKILKDNFSKQEIIGEDPLTGKDIMSERYERLKSYLEMSAELFQVGQLMNVSEKGVGSWPELKMSESSLNKFRETSGAYKYGKFKHIDLHKDLQMYKNIEKSVEAQKYAEKNFGIMEKPVIQKLNAKLTEYVQRPYESLKAYKAFERVVQRLVMNEVFPSGKTEEQLFDEIQGMRENLKSEQAEFFEYTDIDFVKNKPRLGVLNDVRQTSEDHVLEASKKAFEKLPYNLQELILEYNEKVYNSTFSIKGGALTRSISDAKQIEFGKRTRKVRENKITDEWVENLSEVEILDALFQNIDFLHVIKDKKDPDGYTGYAVTNEAIDPEISLFKSGKLKKSAPLSKWKEGLNLKKEVAQVLPQNYSEKINPESHVQPSEVVAYLPTAIDSMKGTREYQKLLKFSGGDAARAAEKIAQASRGEQAVKPEHAIRYNSAVQKFWKRAKSRISPDIDMTSDYAKNKTVNQHEEFSKENSRARENNLKSDEQIDKELIEHLAKEDVQADLKDLDYGDMTNVFSLDGRPEWRNSQRRQKNLRGTSRDDMYCYHFNTREPDDPNGVEEVRYEMPPEMEPLAEELREEIRILKGERKKHKKGSEKYSEITDEIKRINEQLKDMANEIVYKAPGPMPLDDFIKRVMPQYGGIAVSSLPTVARERIEEMYYGKMDEDTGKQTTGYVGEWRQMNSEFFHNKGILKNEQTFNDWINFQRKNPPQGIGKKNPSNAEILEFQIKKIKREYKTIGPEFVLKILEDRLAKEQILEMVRNEHSPHFEGRKVATRALYDILTITENKNEDWSDNDFVSGKYSVYSPSRLREGVMQLNESLIRERRRMVQVETMDLNDEFQEINKRLLKHKGNLEDITYEKTDANGKTIQYFAKEGSEQLYQVKSKAENGDQAAKAMLDLLNFHLREELKTGRYSWDAKEKAYRVPQAEADIFELLFGNMEGKTKKEMAKMLTQKNVIRTFKSRLASQTGMDNYTINLQKAGIKKGKYGLENEVSYGDIKNAIIESMETQGSGINAIRNNAKAIRDLKKIKEYAESLAKQGTDDVGAPTSTQALDRIKPTVGFEKTDTKTTNIAASISKHHQGMIYKKHFEGLVPILKYAEGYLERSGYKQMKHWLKLHNDEALFGNQPDSALGKYQGMLNSLASLTYAKMLGGNWMTAVFNLVQGHTQTFREIGFKPIIKAYQRLSSDIPDGNPHKAFAANKAMRVMDMFEIVSVSKDTEMNITKKSANKVSNVLFSNIVIPERINHALSFIGQMTDEEWKTVDGVMSREGSREDMVYALGGIDFTQYGVEKSQFTKQERDIAYKKGLRRIDELQEITQVINGAYGRNAKRRINSTPEGRLIMMFKNWIPELVLAHVSPEFNDLYGRNRKGIFNSAADVLKNMRKRKGWAELGWALSGENKQEKFELLSEIDQQNVRKLFREILATSAIALAISGLVGDDDEELSKSQKKLRSMLQRALDENLFVIDPSSYVSIFGVLPVVKTLEDMIALSWSLMTLDQYETTNGYVEKGDLKATHYVYKNIPHLNQWRSSFNTLTELTSRD